MINAYIQAVFGFIGGIFSEPNGKPSFSRVFAAFIVWNIVDMANTGAPVSSEMMIVFGALMGTQTIAKFAPGAGATAPAIAALITPEKPVA